MLNTTKLTTQSTINGQYMRHRIRNFADGFTIFDVRVEDKIITCSGNIIIPKAHVMVEVTGTWVDSKYGKQLQNCTLKELLSDYDSKYEYLLKIPSIGQNIAAAVADGTTLSLDEIINLDSAKRYLMDTTKIKAPAAEAICKYLRENTARTKLFSLIAKLEASAKKGYSNAYAITERIFEKYGENSVNALIANPYEIGIRFGLSFISCDYIRSMTTSRHYSDDPKRLSAAIESIVNRSETNGDCCIPFRDASSSARKMLGNDGFVNAGLAPSNILIANAMCGNNGALQLDHNRVYSRSMYWQEVRTAYAIHRIIRSGHKTDCNPDELCDYAESICGVKYAEQQREAFQAFKYGGLCVLTGGPGTGKTTVVKGLLTAYEKLFPDNIIKLCAPTGRASQRMKEATGREACTVHRLLDYRPYGDSFTCKGEADPIEADLIVVDESSMISIDMAEMLFSAVSNGTMVLLVGDTAQLPSVGPGNVLADIIRSGVAPLFALTKTQRQGAGSPIIENAKRINAGDHNLMQNKDFTVMQCDEESLIRQIRNHYIMYHKDNDPFSVQVLTTTKKDKINGCNAINKKIQAEVNPNRKGGVRYGDTVFYVGDKVMMMRNNYEIGYFNGDVGLIKSTSPKEIVVEINGEDITVPTSLLEDMSLAYACTIHKSQGSEYGVVIVNLPPRPHSMLQRNILYTAITRAKKRVILISTEKTISTCCTTISSTQRETYLCERLQESYRR